MDKTPQEGEELKTKVTSYVTGGVSMTHYLYDNRKGIGDSNVIFTHPPCRV